MPQTQQQTATPSCPKCGGTMWDNRLTKRNPAAPDFKCKDRSCDGVVWPPRAGNGNGGGKPAAAPAAAPTNGYQGDLPGDPAPRAQQPAPPAPAAAPAPAKAERTLTELAREYRACLRHAKSIAAVEIEGILAYDAGTVTTIAATLFIQAQREHVRFTVPTE